MKIGVVSGNVVSTINHPFFDGRRLMICDLITPDGKIKGRLTRNRAGMMINTVDPGQNFYDPVTPFRHLAMEGTYHTGKLVRDRRSKDRKCL